MSARIVAAASLLSLLVQGCTVGTDEDDVHELHATFVEAEAAPTPSIRLVGSRLSCCGNLGVAATTVMLPPIGSYSCTLTYAPDALTYATTAGIGSGTVAVTLIAPGRLQVIQTFEPDDPFRWPYEIVFRAERQGVSPITVEGVRVTDTAGVEIPGVEGLGGTAIVERGTGDV